MNPEIKKQWAEALRSGKYKQGFGCLRKEDSYCCLGVLCDISEISEWSRNELEYLYRGNSITLPSKVIQWAELDNNNSYLGEFSCCDHNDGDKCVQKTFNEIADLIEEYL